MELKNTLFLEFRKEFLVNLLFQLWSLSLFTWFEGRLGPCRPFSTFTLHLLLKDCLMKFDSNCPSALVC